MQFTGALFIGGKSSRMGFPKSLLPRGNTSLGHHLLQLLERVTGCQPLMVGAGCIGPHTLCYRQVPDHQADAGPLAGLHALFQQHPGQHFLVLAVDMPHMNAPALNWLIQQARQQPELALKPLLAGRKFGEPLAACYPAAMGPMLAQAWQRGERAVRRALPESLCCQPTVPAEHQAAFRNTNTPGEWQQAGFETPAC